MRIIIVGASGTIGHQLYADACAQGLSVIGTCLTRGGNSFLRFDMTEARLPGIVSDLSNRDCVYLLAAFTDLHLISSDPKRSEEINVHATKRLIDDVFSRGAKLVFMSTDEIFDGKTGGYSEVDRVSPTTVYGAQKAEIEQHLQSAQEQWCIARTGKNVSYRPIDRCPILNTYRTLLGEGAKMATDNVFNITDVRDTSLALLALGKESAEGTFHIVSSPPVTRVELAELVMRYSRFGDSMGFDQVSCDEIEYFNSRPKKPWLLNKKAVLCLGAKFAPPEEVVRQKARLIDDWNEAKVI